MRNWGRVAGWLRAPALAIGVFVAAGCGDDGTSGGPPTPAAQACLDVADAVGKAGVRCDPASGYQANHDAFVQAAVGGNCANTVSVRDRAALYDTCIPSFGTVLCPDFMTGNIDASCRGQLLH